jgi:hypothetical protein
LLGAGIARSGFARHHSVPEPPSGAVLQHGPGIIDPTDPSADVSVVPTTPNVGTIH